MCKSISFLVTKLNVLFHHVEGFLCDNYFCSNSGKITQFVLIDDFHTIILTAASSVSLKYLSAGLSNSIIIDVTIINTFSKFSYWRLSDIVITRSKKIYTKINMLHNLSLWPSMLIKVNRNTDWIEPKTRSYELDINHIFLPLLIYPNIKKMLERYVRMTFSE